MKLIDLDEIDLDDDGEMIGLDDQIEQIREDFPEGFSPRRRRCATDNGGSGGGNGTRASPKDVGGANRKPEKDDKPRSWKETLAERMGTS